MKPILQALLVADRIYEDRATRKKIVAGIFHHIGFIKAVPVEVVEKDGVKHQFVPGGIHAGSPYAYISLTEIRGTQPFVLRYVRLADETPLFQTEFQIQCDDPLQTVEVVAPLPPLPAVEPGTYALELLWGIEPIGTFRIQVEEVKQKGSPNED